MPIDRRTAFRALAALAVAMVTILVPALRAAAHDPIILTDEQTAPASGPLLLDGTVSFAVYGVVDAPGATRGFRLRFAAGDTFTLSALVPDLLPEQSLEGDQFPRITVTTPSGSELALPPGPVTTFAEPFSKTNCRRYLTWSSPAEAGDCGVLITGAVPAAERELKTMARLAEDPLEKAQTGAHLASIAIERDQVAAVLPKLEAAAEASNLPYLDAWVAHTRALDGDLRGADEALETVLQTGIGKLPDDPSWNVTIALLVETSLLVGRSEVPSPLTEALDRWPFPYLYSGPGCFGATARLRGNIAHLTGHDDEAMTPYEQAITDHQTLGAVPWLATTRLDQAQLCLDGGEPDRAAAYVRAALDDIGDLPLTRRRNRALELLARIEQ